MNGRERFAGAVLILTLTIGIAVDIYEKSDRSAGVPLPTEMGSAAGDSSGPEGVGGAAAGVCEEVRRLDLNSATVEELLILPGIGPKKAEAIVVWRNERRGFGRVDDLLEVRGIGRATLERVRPYVCVGEGGEARD